MTGNFLTCQLVSLNQGYYKNKKTVQLLDDI